MFNTWCVSDGCRWVRQSNDDVVPVDLTSHSPSFPTLTLTAWSGRPAIGEREGKSSSPELRPHLSLTNIRGGSRFPRWALVRDRTHSWWPAAVSARHRTDMLINDGLSGWRADKTRGKWLGMNCNMCVCVFQGVATALVESCHREIMLYLPPNVIHGQSEGFVTTNVGLSCIRTMIYGESGHEFFLNIRCVRVHTWEVCNRIQWMIFQSGSRMWGERNYWKPFILRYRNKIYIDGVCAYLYLLH